MTLLSGVSYFGGLPEECSSLNDKDVTLVFLVCVRLVRVAPVYVNLLAPELFF